MRDAGGRRTVRGAEPGRGTLRDLADATPERGVCVARELTKVHEEFVRSTCAALSTTEREWIGEVVLVLAAHVPEDAEARSGRRRAQRAHRRELCARSTTPGPSPSGWPRGAEGREREVYERVGGTEEALRPRSCISPRRDPSRRREDPMLDPAALVQTSARSSMVGHRPPRDPRRRLRGRRPREPEHRRGWC